MENYRKAYGLFCSTGILANHESPLRNERFVTQKIIKGVKEIKKGEKNKLILGNLNIWRDWGWAEEYVEAMIKIIESKVPDDFVIATGKSYSLYEFAENVFQLANLQIVDHLEIDENLFRPNEIVHSRLNPKKINKKLDWKSKKNIASIIEEMFFT